MKQAPNVRSTFIFLIFFCTVLGTTAMAQEFSSDRSILPSGQINNWLLSDDIRAFSELQEKKISPTPTGLSTNDYLKIIEGQVRAFQKHQDASGRIIDPVTKIEMHYTTPCYAHSVAVLAASGYTEDESLIASGILAMDVATSDMAKNVSPEYAPGQSHGDFFTWPTVMALKLFKNVVHKEKYDTWKKRIETMDPEKYYDAYGSSTSNWNLVNTAGEFLRYTEGLTTLDYVDTSLKNQLYHFTDYGMYSEHGNPPAYDAFARHFVTGMLALGYNGSNYETYRNLLWKGAWMSLFLQSPTGEMPTGYRSSNHIWNEAEQCVIFEIYASEYAKKGQSKIAGAFRRAARLSLKNIEGWIREDGSGHVVKNKYPIEMKHGYEGYSEHSCYNMLSTSMLAQAWQYAKSFEIKEENAPADIGGYAIAIHEPFHKIIASVGGTYLEYDTSGDQLYNPTGIIRVHIKGSHPQLGPSDGLAGKFSGAGTSITTGPTWRAAGEWGWKSLASIQQKDPLIEILQETDTLVKFKVTYETVDGNDKKLEIIQTISIEEHHITIEDELIGDIDALRITWPMLLYNGAEFSKILLAKKHTILELEGKKIKFEVLRPTDAIVYRSNNQYGHQNGLAEPVYVAIKGKKATYRIGLAE